MKNTLFSERFAVYVNPNNPFFVVDIYILYVWFSVFQVIQGAEMYQPRSTSLRIVN